MDGELRLSLLGSPKVTLATKPVGGFRSSKARALLFYLAQTAQVHKRPAVAGLLWGGVDERYARSSLNQTISNLRRIVGDHLVIDRESIAFDPASHNWLDTAQFEQGIVQLDEPDLVAETMALYRGDFLAGFYVQDAPEFEQWVLTEQARLRELALHTLAWLVERNAQRQEWADAIRYARHILVLEPWREETHRQLMLLLAQSGQRSAALAQFEICQSVLAEELAIDPDAETVELANQIRAGSIGPPAREATAPGQPDHTPDAPTSTAYQPPAIHLPTPSDLFVGRQEEKAALRTLLLDEPECRLLTLIGPGGIGKTRLAIAVASGLEEHFADGIFFVELDSVSEPAHIVPAMADALGLAFTGSKEPRHQLLTYLHDRRLLLVVDNFEHLLAGAHLLADIVAAASGVRLFVTSRERLNLREEWSVTVHGMDFPQQLEGNGDAVEHYTAVQLFLRRARRAEATHVIAGDDMAHVARICQLVDGMPLGIELAAAWTHMLSCQEIAQEIEQSLDFLSTSLHNVPARHRSVRAVFEQSWQRLTPAEQETLRKLSVFRGGWTRDAANSIADANLHHLSALLEKALLRRSRHHRYDMHALLRQYTTAAQPHAAPSLETAQHDFAQLRARYCTYYLGLVGDYEPALRGQKPQEAVARFRLDLDNIRQAWRWASEDKQWSLLHTGASGLARFYALSGLFLEGERLFAQNVDAISDPTPAGEAIRCRLHIEQAGMLFAQGVLVQAAAIAQRAVESAQSLTPSDGALDDTLPAEDVAAHRQGLELEALARFEVGRCLHKQGEHAAAPAHYARSLKLARTVGNRPLEAEVLRYWCWNCYDRGDFDSAIKMQTEAEALYRQLGDRLGQGVAQFDRAYIAYLQGDKREARTRFELALRDFRQIGERRFQCFAVWNLGLIARTEGCFSKSLALMHEALTLARTIQDQHSEISCLTTIGHLLSILGDYEQAKQYLDQAVAMDRDVGDRRNIAHWSLVTAYSYHAQGKFEAAAPLIEEGLAIAKETNNLELLIEMLPLFGHIQLALGHYDSARQVYKEDFEMLMETDDRQQAVEPLAGLARLHQIDGNADAALAKVTTVLESLAQEGAAGLREPFLVYLHCYKILAANQDARAPAVLSTAHALLQQAAALIDDEHQRRSFLERVAVNRTLQELAVALAADP